MGTVANPACCETDADCNDGQPCTFDKCIDNTCSNPAKTCNADGNPCTLDTCNDATGSCNSPLPDGTPCALGQCQNGECVAVLGGGCDTQGQVTTCPTNESAVFVVNLQPNGEAMLGIDPNLPIGGQYTTMFAIDGLPPELAPQNMGVVEVGDDAECGAPVDNAQVWPIGQGQYDLQFPFVPGTQYVLIVQYDLASLPPNTSAVQITVLGAMCFADL